MQTSESIVCKPTPWFTLRAGAMLAMFSVFCVMFYIDGTTGYRKKNLEYYLEASFQEADKDFKRMKSAGDLSPESWREFAMKSGQPHLLWQEFSGEQRMSKTPPKEPFSAAKIHEQIIVFYVCLSLSLLTLFFLIRTMRRSISADSAGLTTVTGKVIPYDDMKTLDLRKWDTKGIALIEYQGVSGSGRARIDGLTYGGFKQENGEPAERLMGVIRENFSGEIIEYTSIEPVAVSPQAPDDARKADAENLP